ncbi:PAS-domain containing protein [Rhodosalinus sp. K401]|uniref:PAS-domain containing protein n=1 Tax=Rhodosalinus sp. K401 TaxID=3239195 RepID=UPI0035267EB6
MPDAATFAAIALGSFAAALLGAWLVPRVSRDDAVVVADPHGEAVVFLMEGPDIADASAPALALLPRDAAALDDWARLRACLGPRFPAFPETPDGVPEGGTRLPTADEEDDACLVLQRQGGVLRVEIEEPEIDASDRHRLALARLDCATLRHATTHAPDPCWRTDATGRVVWANRAYLALAEQTRSWAEGAVPPRLFDLPRPAPGDPPARHAVNRPNGTPIHWFDIRTVPAGGEWVHFATNVDAAVASAAAQRQFVQTLTKIFAELSIGLAVFDRERRLVLFNPALLDLTGMPADLLSARPALATFFDQLRERRIMPEPKDYGSWREATEALATAASTGRCAESWSLPSGLTYRVTGRPHPDGAVAFLFEDITAEVSLTRRFRTEIELGQAVLDALEEALAVFSPQGVIVFTNRAYRRLWAVNPDARIRDTTAAEALRLWQTACRPGPDWDGLAAALSAGARTASWREAAVHRDGPRLDVRVRPLGGGAAVVSFGIDPRRLLAAPDRPATGGQRTADVG